jgi:hypothetical protein
MNLLEFWYPFCLQFYLTVRLLKTTNDGSDLCAGAPVSKQRVESSVGREAGNGRFCLWQEKFYAVALRGVGNVSGTP